MHSFPSLSGHGVPVTSIMHQHTCIGDIIGMVIRDPEVIDPDRRFEDLVLDLFNDYIFTVDQLKDISGPKLAGLCPAFYRRIEGMGRCRNDLLAAYENVDQLVRFVDVGFNDFF